MPNRDTFSIGVIGDFVKMRLVRSRVSVDPYARNKRWATWTNDLNPETAAEWHMDAGDFLVKLVREGVVADLVILDPPYSPRQIKECYEAIGKVAGREDTQGARGRKRIRGLVNEITGDGAVVLSFGWNSTGMGKGWEREEIMLVCHGSDHNDTICIAERKGLA